MKTFLPHSAAVAQQWEIAKGHLRAVVALQGACTSGDGDTSHYDRCAAAVTKFIARFEDERFNEGCD